VNTPQNTPMVEPAPINSATAVPIRPISLTLTQPIVQPPLSTYQIVAVNIDPIAGTVIIRYVGRDANGGQVGTESVMVQQPADSANDINASLPQWYTRLQAELSVDAAVVQAK